MRRSAFILCIVILAGCGSGGASQPPSDQRIFTNVEYANVGGHRLALDLFLPNGRGPFPVVMWIHGGGFALGARTDHVPMFLVEAGFAVAAIDYRLSDVAPFPAQIHDCKAAVRWLRAHQVGYRLDGSSIGAMGESAGGHLAALLGASGGVAVLEGTGGNPGESSRVQAVFDEFGPTDLGAEWDFLIATNNTILQTMIIAFLGGTPAQQPVLATQANPITWVSGDDPPFLIFHGDADPLVPVSQSQALDTALDSAGRPSWLYIFPGVDHIGVNDELGTPDVLTVVVDFFTSALHPSAPIASY